MTTAARTIAVAWAHIHDRTLAGVSLAAFRTALHDPRVQAAEYALDAAVGADAPVTVVQQRCQNWNRAWREALKAQKKEAA